METQTFQFGDYKYEYFLVYEERKTLRLTVYPNLTIVLHCPEGHPKEKIEKLLKRKWLWLEKQIKDLRRFQKNAPGKEYVSGESFLYLGRQYKLVIKESDKEGVSFEAGKIIVSTTRSHVNTEQNKLLLEKWYEARAEQVFNERYCQMLKKFDYEFTPEIALRKMEKRWGSFLAKKKILLNPELIKASKECIDSVIIHELCHMTYQNHSAEFYKLLEAKLPGWKKVKEKLELRFL